MRSIAFAAMVSAAAALPASAGDPARGERVFQRCYACHSIEPAETGLPGPNLHGVVGRPAGADQRFEYSPALRALARRDHVWTAANLDAFLIDPLAVAPGNAMAFFGLRDDRDRADLIAYLKHAAE